MLKELYIALVIVLFCSPQCLTFGIFSFITDTMGLTESCYSKWIPANITGLHHDIRTRVYGQPFIYSALIPLLQHHYYGLEPSNKALAISFHGSPGTGKNFVTELIVKNIYKKGMDSKFLHFFNGISDFPQSSKVDYYKLRIGELIQEKLTLCKESMFIFDESDKIPRGILDVLKAFIDSGKRIDGVDYRRAIYIFLSNVGEKHISDETLSLWRRSVERNEFHIQPFHDILFKATFNEHDAFKYSVVVRSALIDLYLPFLPLEKKHVVKCILTELKRQNYTDSNTTEIVNNIISELTFGPPPENIFSSHGCKHIETKVVLQLATKSKEYLRFLDEF